MGGLSLEVWYGYNTVESSRIRLTITGIDYQSDLSVFLAVAAFGQVLDSRAVAPLRVVRVTLML